MKKKLKKIEVGASIFEENDRIAEENRRVFKSRGIFCVNIMGSPGSGKTTILEKTITGLKKKGYSPAVVEGDIKGSIDGERLEALGIPVVQINTGGACHLDANMIKKGLESLDVERADVLFIENVGNLVCPAEFKLGEDINIVVSSVPEGEEKPLKYPLMFKISAICLLNKTDLVAYTGFNTEIFKNNLAETAPSARFIPVSAKTGSGFDMWLDSLVSLFSQPRLPEDRTVVLGMGDRMKGDDGAGCEVSERLGREINRNNVKIINAENAVENYLGPVAKFKPGRVVLVDAVDFGGQAGEVKILEPRQVREATSSTHTFSLPVILEHIKNETGAQCLIVGIQPAIVAFTEGLSSQAEEGVGRAVRLIKELLAKT